jgi:hypothetical protein
MYEAIDIVLNIFYRYDTELLGIYVENRRLGTENITSRLSTMMAFSSKHKGREKIRN